MTPQKEQTKQEEIERINRGNYEILKEREIEKRQKEELSEDAKEDYEQAENQLIEEQEKRETHNPTAEEYLKDKRKQFIDYETGKGIINIEYKDVLHALTLKEQEVEDLIKLHEGDPDACVGEILDLREQLKQATFKENKWIEERGRMAKLLFKKGITKW